MINNIIFLVVVFISFINLLFAGAPALNEDPIPPAPYSLIKTNHLIFGVEWDKGSIKEFLPLTLSDKTSITGGINIFNSKKKQSFSPLSGGYAWIDFPNNGKIEKIVLFSIYGLNKSINNIMKKVYNLNSEMGSNRVTLINNNAVANTSIRKKNVLSLSATDSKDCIKTEGKDFLITNTNGNEKTYKIVKWSTKKQCKVNPTKIEFKGVYQKYVVKKMLWAVTQTDTELTFEDKFIK